MIASLNGIVSQVAEDSLVINLGGLGLRVYVPTHLRNRMSIGNNLELQTYLVVREDLLSLYGFETAEERDFFILLLGVNGVGPRTALNTLSVLNPDSIRRAVASEQSDVFSRVPGVGKKTAQKILIHLQGRICVESPLGQIASLGEVEAEVLAALTTLGYSVVEAQTALQTIPADAPQDVETRLRMALQYFSS